MKMKNTIIAGYLIWHVIYDVSPYTRQPTVLILNLMTYIQQKITMKCGQNQTMENAWYITLLKNAGFMNLIVICHLQIFLDVDEDMSIEPTVDNYHTFSNYISNYKISYLTGANGQQLVGKGHAMRLRGKKNGQPVHQQKVNNIWKMCTIKI